jgi:phosphoglycolate phosphatase-like HAD superfamily hydrolase
MIKNFIFDIDGTLLDSNDYHAEAWHRAFAAYGKNISLRSLRLCMGEGADQLLPKFINKKEIKEFGKDLDKLSGEIFKRNYLSKVRPFPKVRQLFKKIRQSGIRIALASSGSTEEVKKYEKIARIQDLVEHSTSADDADKSKPSPDIFHAALNLLDHPRHDSVLVIGDSPYDALAAKKAKLTSIGVLCGGFSKKILKAHGCYSVYKSPEDLLQNLETILNVHNSSLLENVQKMKEYELYVPLVSENGKRLPAKELKNLKRRLVTQFGGVTHFPQKTKGAWRIGQATYFDEIVILRVLIEEKTSERTFWRKLKNDLQHQWKQKHVLIIVRDVYSL